MTIWSPVLEDARKPKYLAIADAIGEAIDAGDLEPGDRLPTHRALARELAVTVGTVSRAYAEAERRGLTIGEVGRGTFVKKWSGDEVWPGDGWAPGVVEEDDRIIDLSLNFPPVDACADGRLLAETLRDLAARPDLACLLRYQKYSGSARQRAAGAEWIRRTGLDAGPERVLVAAGAQHALNVVFATLARPGDVVLTEALTYPGMKSLAQMLDLRLVGVPLDEHGPDPEALARACEKERPVAFYCIPTIQNPTGASVPADRRREIATIAREHDLLLVEDDVHAFLVPDCPPPIAASAPERACYIASTGKSVAPGLRVSYLLAPEHLVERLDAGVRSTVWMASPLTAEISAKWIADGSVDGVIERKREEIARRQAIAAELLEGYDYGHHRFGLHLWLQLPAPWRSADFVAQAKQRGVLVTGAEAFAVGREEMPHAVRICIGGPSTTERFTRGLAVLREILDGRSEPCGWVV